MAADYTVGTDKTYTTWAAAIAAIPADLAGEGKQSMIIDAGIYNEQNLTIDKANGSATDYIEVRPATGDEHHGVWGSGVIHRGGQNAIISLNVLASYTKILDIEFQNSLNYSVRAHTGGNIEIIRCISKWEVQFSSDKHHGFSAYTGGGNNKILSCWSWGQSNNIRTGFEGGNPTANCVAVNNSTGFLNGKNINCISAMKAGGTADFSGLVAGSGYNCSTDTTAATGDGNLISQDIDDDIKFVDVAAGDFHIQATSVLVDAGSDQSAVVTKDIDGETFTVPYPIGADILTVSSTRRKLRLDLIPNLT